MTAKVERALFAPIPRSVIGARLSREVRDALREFVRRPASYLRAAFLPDHADDLLLVRLARRLASAAWSFARHPIKFISDLRRPDWVAVVAMNASTLSWVAFIEGALVASAVGTAKEEIRPRRRIRIELILSGAAHSVLIGYLIYVMFFSPFTGITVVRKPYRKLDITQVLGPLRYPPGMLRAQRISDKTLSLDEIRERARKRREELARQNAEREKAEQERLAKEREAQQKAAELAKKQAEAGESQTKFGEINETPIKDIVGKVYALYRAGDLDIENKNYSVGASFKIERDGSISNIRIFKSSGYKVIDEKAIEILWNLGESHAIGPLAKLSSTTIRLDVTDDITRLTITGFAPSPDEAKGQADLLNFLLFAVRVAQKSKSPDVAELLSLMKVKSDGNRVDANLTVSRARAAEMMSTKFGTPQ